MEVERRYFLIGELRSVEDDFIEGYAAVYNKLSEDLGGFREKIKQGAFANALKRSDTVMLWNHDPNIPLARVSAGNLELREDKKGLLVKAKLPKTAAREIEAIKLGIVKQMSFGFTTEKDEWLHKKNESIRTLVEVGELPDVSPVVFPAYPDTTIALRSLERSKATAAPTHRRGGAASSEPAHRRGLEIDDKTYWRTKKGE